MDEICHAKLFRWHVCRCASCAIPTHLVSSTQQRYWPFDLVVFLSQKDSDDRVAELV